MGSANIDILNSFVLYENSLEIYNERLACHPEEVFELEKTNAEL